MTKRKFLVTLVGAVVGIVTLKHFRPRLRDFADGFRPRLPTTTGGSDLSPSEMEHLIAFGEVLVESRALSVDEREIFQLHINDRVGVDRDYLGLYRLTAEVLQELAQGRFSKLSREERVRTLERKKLTSYHVGRKECLLPWGKRERTVRVLAVPDLIAGYYSSEAGWAMVRYQNFPGRCSNLQRYQHAEP